MLHYLGEAGPRHIVQEGNDEFTVTPAMVANSYAEATAPVSNQPRPPLKPIAAAVMIPESDPARPPAAEPLRSPSPPMVVAASGPSAPVNFEAKFPEFSRDLLIADGLVGKGSGCLVKYQGSTVVVTNAHVLSGNPNVKFQRINSKEVDCGPFSFAQGADHGCGSPVGRVGGAWKSRISRRMSTIE